jgi:hypothetical protein
MIRFWYRYMYPIIIVGMKLQGVAKENYEMLMLRELKREITE